MDEINNSQRDDADSAADARYGRVVPVWRDGLAIALLVVLVSYFWWPALASGKVILHLDSAHHGLSLLTMLHQWLHQELDSLLWAPGIYGGHPLFAESQGGFLNPTNIIAAYFFEPTVAFGVVHWLDMLVSGLGVYVLCRVLHMGSWPALFAAFAVTHATLWLFAQNNLSVHGAMVWAVWTMAAVQYWLNAPSASRALLMAVPAALLAFAGYPHLAHGLAIFFGCMALAWLLHGDGRAYIATHLGALLVGGVLAGLAAWCLSAVQLLPLIELLQNSHRSEGVDLLFDGVVSAQSYVSGTLFFTWNDGGWLPSGVFGFLCASILVALCAILKPDYRITGYLLATFVLFNLGIGSASPLFRLVYEHGLIPGLDAFRFMQPYLLLAVIGLGVLAASAISRICSAPRTQFIRALSGSRLPETALLAGFFAVCLATSVYFYIPSMSAWNYAFGVAGLGAILVLIQCARRRWIAPVLALLLAVEIVVLRSGIYNFYDVSTLERPASVAAIQREEDYQDFYAYHLNTRSGLGLMVISSRPGFDRHYAEILGSLMSFPSLQWGISSINGALALDLKRRAMLNDVLRAESVGESKTPPGSRLIDTLGIRYFSFTNETHTPGFSLLFSNPAELLNIYRNDYALPKVRSYFDARAVRTPEVALKLVLQESPDTLILESARPIKADDVPCNEAEPSARIERIAESAQYHKVGVESSCAGWLYLGGAYYPGWSALVNGLPAELYPAQVLGKAVKFPEGSSVVEVSYWPYKFYLGAIVSGITWLAVGLFLCWRTWRAGRGLWHRWRSRGS